MDQVDAIYREVKDNLSLRVFMRIVGLPYWLLRDYRRSGQRRTEAARRQRELIEQINTVALEGYRRLWRVLIGHALRMDASVYVIG